LFGEIVPQAYFSRNALRTVGAAQAPAGADVGQLEAIGALNFLDLDDILVVDEGESIDPRSVITLPIENERPLLPKFERSPNHPFLRQLNASGKKWVIILDTSGSPSFVTEADHFLRDSLFNAKSVDAEIHWHPPDHRNGYEHTIGRRDVALVCQCPGEEPLQPVANGGQRTTVSASAALCWATVNWAQLLYPAASDARLRR
jgi:hypothetical protein